MEEEMKKIFMAFGVAFMIFALSLLNPSALIAGEHGGTTIKEHGGASIISQKRDRRTLREDRETLREAAEIVQSTHPELAAELEDIAEALR